jgi:hypothetical protein
VEYLNGLSQDTWLMVAGVVVAGFILSWILRWYRQYRSRRSLRNSVTGAAADALVDMLVPDGMGGGYHVDFLLLTARGILVVDLRDVQGKIFAGDQMAEWTVFDGPRRVTFANPLSALYDRIAAVKAVAGDVPVEGRIVFTRRGIFPKGLPKFTLMVDSLKAEFPSVGGHDTLSGSLGDAWGRIKGVVKPSYMTHMRG